MMMMLYMLGCPSGLRGQTQKPYLLKHDDGYSGPQIWAWVRIPFLMKQYLSVFEKKKLSLMLIFSEIFFFWNVFLIFFHENGFFRKVGFILCFLVVFWNCRVVRLARLNNCIYFNKSIRVLVHERGLGPESIFTNPSARAGYDTRSIFKRRLTGLISEFSFSYTSYLTNAEEPSLSYYSPIAGGK